MALPSKPTTPTSSPTLSPTDWPTSTPTGTPKIRVLQLLDKTAIRGASIHGVSRLILRWWPEFEGSDIELKLTVLRAADEADSVFQSAGVQPEYLGRGRFDPRTLTDIAGVVRRDRIDVIHCHGYGASTFGRIVGLFLRIPVLVHEHFVDENYPFYQRWIDRILGPTTLRGLAVSRAVEAFLSGARSIPQNCCQVLYNSVPDASSSEPVSHEGFRVGIIGRLDPVKGHSDFLDAAAKVSGAVPGVEFWIIGDGALEAELSSQAECLGISGQVKFLGHRNDVGDLLPQIDLVVACSHSEGFSLAAAEAMSHRIAVVGTKVGGIQEVVQDRETGILVPDRAPGVLAEAIIQLLKDTDLRMRMGVKGQERCLRYFSMATTVEALENLYRAVTRRRG